MGRRRQRKRARREQQRSARTPDAIPEPTDEELFELEAQAADWDWLMAEPRLTGAPAKSCGRCREFVEDGEGGRGTCLHPGSGILAPWTDTPACDFFSPRRR